jgi:hypothetical protein
MLDKGYGDPRSLHRASIIQHPDTLGSLKTEPVPELPAESPDCRKIDRGNVDLLQFGELLLNPAIDSIQASKPSSEVVLVQKLRGLNHEAMSPPLMDALALHESIVICGVYPNGDEKIIESASERSRLPVTP